jgi:hypothetical protein
VVHDMRCVEAVVSIKVVLSMFLLKLGATIVVINAAKLVLFRSSAQSSGVEGRKKQRKFLLVLLEDQESRANPAFRPPHLRHGHYHVSSRHLRHVLAAHHCRCAHHR